jgi:short-subunit dehydrogenase
MTTTRTTALITGASTGIGRSLARVFARQGHDLAITARHEEPLQTLKQELTAAFTVNVHTAIADLSAPDGAALLRDDLDRAGVTVDVLVNNAGVGVFGDFPKTDLAEELRLIQLNVSSLVALTKYYLPGMIARRRGRILHVASTAAFLPGPHMSVYYASKAFVLSFSDATADEVRDTGVTISVLCPGPTTSNFQARARMERSRLVQGTMMDADTVAEAGYRGLMRGTRVIIPGLMNRVVPVAVRLLPRGIMTAISRRAAEVA